MSIEFYTDKAGERRWHVLDGKDITHACHEGFSSKYNALQNLFINHALMSIFVAGVASDNEDLLETVSIEVGNDGKFRWKIRAGNNEVVGIAHQGFDTRDAAVENLIHTYTMLSVFVTKSARAKLSEGE